MDGIHPVAILPPAVSRRIAAGEVIERPASVVRELIDNSLDAGAEEIDITWSGGGVETLRVRDNGYGLNRADLELCWKAHATSKIRSIEDLDHATSLGFRGEALSSIAAVSTLTITTTRRDENEGFRLTVHQATDSVIEPAPPTPGTTVEIRQLFANLPARRRFLSRPQAETTAIRNVIRDKAAPFPEIRFTFESESGSRTVLPPQDLVTRIADLFGNVAPVHTLREITGTGDGFSVHIVAAVPEIVRRDRRYIRVFVNKRRVWEYRLIQAVEYAFQDVQHGGLFPVAAVFLDIDPELVDVNIHPAKREVRIRPSAEVHHRIVELLRSFLRAYTVRTVQMDRDFPAWNAPAHAAEPPTNAPRQAPDHGNAGTRWTPPPPAPRGTPPREFPSFRPDVRAVPAGRPLPDNATTAAEAPRERDDHERALEAARSDGLTYQGTVFDTYVIVEFDDRAYLIDQHAAHERLLYNHLQEHRTRQPLLVPEEFTVTEDQDTLLSRHVDDYEKLGIGVERIGECRWRITAVPPEYAVQMEAIVETLVELDGLNEAADRTFLAELACKAAVKGGDFVDGLTALELARRTLALETPRCPHGRPLWVELSRRHLERLIGRA